MAKGPAPFDQGLFLMHLHKGKEYFDQNQLQKAREELEAAYHLRPQDEKVLNLLGMAYFKLEMLPQAEEMYVTLASNNPEVYTLQSNLGLIRLKLDKLDLSEESLTRALELMPGNPKAHFYLGLLYEKWAKWEKALHHFEQAKADKMIEKVKHEIEEAKKKVTAVEILPFEVLEVIEEKRALPEEITEAFKVVKRAPPAPSPGLTAMQQAESLLKSRVLSKTELDVRSPLATGKMLKADVEEALARKMEAIKKEELPKEEGGAESLFEEAVDISRIVKEGPSVQRTGAFRAVTPPPLPPSAPPLAATAEEEELVEDVTPHVSAGEEGHIEEEEPLWEKTQPKLVVPEPRPVMQAPEPQPEVEKTGPVTPPASPLFLAEEMAADISTFLAESRVGEEEQAAATDFIQEPPAAPVEETFVESQPVAQEPLEEQRIPSPQEVENETRDMGEEPLFEKEEPEEEPAVVEEPQPEVEAAPEPPAAISQPAPAAAKPEPPPPAVVPEVPVVERAPIMMPVPAPQPPRVELPAVAKVAAPVAEPYQAANLDQFSRDRFYVQPLIGADRFLLIDPHLLEIIVSDKIFCRRGTISSFTGSLQFAPWPSLEEELMVEVSGAGILFLADRRKEIFLISLNNEEILVESSHLLVAQSALKLDTQVFEDKITERSFSMFRISGRGTVALTCQTKPLTLNVHESMPVNIPADALIAMSGHVKSEILQDEDLRKILMTAEEGTIFLRFSGNGDVVVEQGSLWGDRRAKR